ncbi:endolytic transglycosylase MltG [Streptomyces sp. NPDC001339]|uniref:endolytic transglycosylase MltG n=1 Tax=Streptomyces sp. NPDC001339 TaxID=3364563 RepID=UPI00368593DE
MTEYGRGYGSEPWHPDDPLYGDQGSYGGQAQQPQWGGQQSVPQQYRGPQQHPQQQYHEGGGWDGSQAGPPVQGGPGAPGGHPPHGGQLPYDPYDTYGRPAPADPYAGTGQDYMGQGYAGQDYTGQDYYGHGHQDPYQQQPQQHVPQVPQQMPPYPRHEQPYPPQQYEQPAPPPPPPHHQDVGDDWRDGPERPRDPERPREPGPEHSFFADDDEGGRPEDDPRERRGKRNGKDHEEDREDGTVGKKTGKKAGKKKRRSGTACLIVTLLLAGTVGAVGYFGYDFLKARFGSAPDYEGEGSGDVQVEIPDGSPVVKMGQILAEKGVIKSAGAFTEAAEEKKATALQPGTYSLRKSMSAAAAIELMLDPKSRNGLTIREGLRAGAVYELIDKKLKLKPGTTKDVAKNEVKNLGLPSWANNSPKIKDPLEGFLFPSTYSVGGHVKPADVLKQMVGRATKAYSGYDLEAAARKFGLKSPLEVITVASLTQAEGMTHDDFRKMAAVVYNRLAPANTDTNQKLQFDSTYNYLKNQSKIDISLKEINNYDDPYNTYFYRGLPPGPIGNPGIEALKATVAPDTTKRWLYFVSIDDKKTEFATDLTEHNKLVEARKKWQREHPQNGN